MSEPCWFCGSVEGSDGSPPADDGDGIPYHDELKCLPLSESWSLCDDCAHALPKHDLVSLSRFAISFAVTCKSCTSKRKWRDEIKAVPCECEACIDRKIAKAVGGRSPRPSRSPQEPRSASKAARAASTAAPSSSDRQRALTEALSEPRSTEELAQVLGVTPRTVRRDLAAIGAVEVKDGKHVRWTVPS